MNNDLLRPLANDFIPSLRTRHSAYPLSQPPIQSAGPAIPNPTTRRPSANREDITPWEFQTMPFAPASLLHPRPSLPTGLVEDVAPWELYPAPEIPVSSPRKSKHLRAGRPLSSSGPNKTLSELGLGGRRKSIGSKAGAPSSPRARLTATVTSPSRPSTVQHHHPLHNPIGSDTVFTEPFTYSPAHSTSATSVHLSSTNSMPRAPLFLSLKKTPSASKLHHARQNGGGSDPKFSTADRKILQELALSRNAREAQFVKKGNAVSFGMNGTVPGKKHHAYPPRDVPYPRSYEREVLDLDVWETTFCHDSCGSVTWHMFKTPPTKVLDLGCGTGSWILNCAKVWKNCHFVGLDIVPLHPDLSLIGSLDLASRITWVQANFLDKLPFPDEEFDYVHIKRIALGVPEDKWDSLLEEITRVMKSGAAFELIEEDLFFPGKQVDSDSESDAENEETRSVEAEPDSLSPMRETAIAETEEVEGDDDEVREYEVVYHPSSGHGTPTTARPSLHVKTSQESWHQSSNRPPMPKKSTSTLSLPSSKAGFSPIKPPEGKPLSADSNVSRIIVPTTVPEGLPALTSEGHDLLTSLPKPPNNPRDHWLLERIYSEMLASRFINISPLSLLANSLSLYFRDLRTHPAIQFTFPPLPPRKYRVFGKVDERKKPEEVEKKVEDCSSDGETCGYETEMDEKSKVLSLQAVLQHESRYISLDETRPMAFSPSKRADFPEANRDMMLAPEIQRGARLPNGQTFLNLKTLNLHLELRVEEVLACSEPMWGWVGEEQRRTLQNPHERNRLMRSRTSISSGESGKSHLSFRDRIADMTREEFDDLLNNFRFDMQDQYSLGYALTDRFNWSISLCHPPPDRATFDAACEKWKNWERQERRIAAMRSRQRSSTYPRSRAVSSSNLSHVSSTTSSPQVARAHSGQSGFSSHSGQTMLSGHSASSSTLVPPINERWDQQSHHHHPLRTANAKGGYDTTGGESKNGRPRGTTHVPPTAKLSRALKVFVGWKP